MTIDSRNPPAAEVKMGRGRLMGVARRTVLLLVAMPALASAADIRKYRQTYDVELGGESPVTRTTPGSLFEIEYEIDASHGVVHRRSVRRLDQRARDTSYPVDYRIVSTATLMREDGGRETVVVAVGQPSAGKVETIWLGETIATSSENSATFIVWHAGRYTRVK